MALWRDSLLVTAANDCTVTHIVRCRRSCPTITTSLRVPRAGDKRELDGILPPVRGWGMLISVIYGQCTITADENILGENLRMIRVAIRWEAISTLAVMAAAGGEMPGAGNSGVSFFTPLHRPTPRGQSVSDTANVNNLPMRSHHYRYSVGA